MLDIKKIAQRETQLSVLMVNREKGATEELIDKTGTIIDCEPCVLTKPNGSEEEVWVYILKEIPNKFFFAGFILEKVFNSIVEASQGDIDGAREAIQKQGLTVKYGSKKTREGNTVTTIEVI